MVKELKNKWKVSGDALGWVVQWKRGGGAPIWSPHWTIFRPIQLVKLLVLLLQNQDSGMIR